MSTLLKVVSRKNNNIKKVKEIYIKSFPKEQRTSLFMMRLLSKTPGTDLLALHDDDIVCGFVYFSAESRTTFLIYMAIDEVKRSHGYGSYILDKVVEMPPSNGIVTYIERCDVAAVDKSLREKRKQFYIKNGFNETGLLINSTKEFQEILIKNGEFDRGEFIAFLKNYSKGALNPIIVEY